MTTIQELIDKLNWFDFLRKIKVILTELNATKVLPIYETNSAALAGGLKVNEPYRNAAGATFVVV